MKTVKSDMLEGEVLVEMILVTSRLRHQSLMVTSNRRTIIGFKPFRESLSSRRTMMRKPLSELALKLKGYAFLWYETLKKSRVRETKSKIKT